MGYFEQRNPLDMVFAAVPSGLRWAISNREIRLTRCLWLSLSGADGLFEQGDPREMVLVAVPFGLRWANRTEKSA